MRTRKGLQYKSFSLPSVFFLIIPLLLVSSSFLIKVKKISCESQYGKCPDVLSRRLSTLEGHSLAGLRSGLEKELSSSNLVTDYSVQYRIPSEVKLNISIRKPIYAIGLTTEKRYALIDKDGVVLIHSSETSLPTVYVSRTLPGEGEVVSANLKFSLDVLMGAFFMYQINEAQMTESSLTIEHGSGLKVIFPIEGDVDLLLGKLRAVYSKIVQNGNSYQEIDLRFRNPILR